MTAILAFTAYMIGATVLWAVLCTPGRSDHIKHRALTPSQPSRGRRRELHL